MHLGDYQQNQENICNALHVCSYHNRHFVHSLYNDMHFDSFHDCNGGYPDSPHQLHIHFVPKLKWKVEVFWDVILFGNGKS